MSQITLFCLPHAGASASIYAKWRPFLNASIVLYPVELAGRGKRLNENQYNSLEEAIDDIYIQIKPLLKSPFALFGHSMGSLLAYELSCKIKQQDGLEPVHLFVSGRKAPQCPSSKRLINLLPDDEFTREIKKLRGTPEEIFQNKELFDFFKPILRADYKMIEEYEPPVRDFILSCGVSVLNGTEDNIAIEELTAWKQLTTGEFNITDFEGGHFFIYENVSSIVHQINEVIRVKVSNCTQIYNK
ncbi:thioesterase II family protein [Paenibacillus sp. FSL R7-0179]|uniref:thioesterase II family protein n=1 Tax=Paenibacillus sp. FSL R7-0179 TaxID=2921672 RepID=UPI0030F7EC91